VIYGTTLIYFGVARRLVDASKSLVQIFFGFYQLRIQILRIQLGAEPGTQDSSD